MTAKLSSRAGAVRGIALAVFLVSGITGLVYEVAWTRCFGTVFGNTVFAASTVLTSFMLGLALGSYLLARRAEKTAKPLKLYALLELAIGLYALLFPFILNLTDAFYTAFYRSLTPSFYILSIVRFTLSALILLPPTAMMGGTLPVLIAFWTRRTAADRTAGRAVSLLYAVNSFGAVIGCFTAGYFLLRFFGIRSTIHIAAAANIAIALLAFALSPFSTHKPAAESSTSKKKARRKKSRKKASKQRQSQAPAHVITTTQRPFTRTAVLLTIAAAGFCSLALEVLWTRVLVFVVGTSVYAFACMLTCFILGIALGSLLCSTFINRIKRPILAVSILEALIALAALASLPVLALLWGIDYELISRLESPDFWREVSIHFFDAAAILLVPTILMGIAFPIAVRACTFTGYSAPAATGRVYAANTLGCVLGAFAAGFILIPALGLRTAFLAVAALQLTAAVFIFHFAEIRWRRLRPAAIVAAAAVIFTAFAAVPPDIFLRTMNTFHHPSEIIYIQDDVTGTITVHNLPDGDRLIAIDGVDVAGVDFMLRTTQKLQAYVPLLIHPQPEKVVQIGFGSGETCGIGLALDVPDYRIVDVCPGIFTAGRFFEDINRGAYKDPRLEKIIMDGKNFVKLTPERFDIIMNDSTYPGTTGSSALYTYDHFAQCRDRLTPGGIQSCWMPLDLRPADFRIILRSFQAAMPYCSLWMADNCLNKHAVLVGSAEPMKLDLARIRAAFGNPVIAADLAEINIHNEYDFLDCFVSGPEAIRAMAGPGPLNTDDHPALEFGAAITRDIQTCWQLILAAIARTHSPVTEHVDTSALTRAEARKARDTLDSYFRATTHVLHGQLAIMDGDADRLQHHFDLAKKINPRDRDIEACMNEIRTERDALLEQIAVEPASTQLRARVARRHMLLEEYTAAAQHYRAYLAIEPGNPGVLNNLGLCLRKTNRPAEALAVFRRALDINPNLLAANYNAASLCARLGDTKTAAKYYERTASLCPPEYRPRYYEELASAYADHNQIKNALAALDKAIALAAPDPTLQDKLKARKKSLIHPPSSFSASN